MEQTQSNKTIAAVVAIILILAGASFYLWQRRSSGEKIDADSSPVKASFDKLTLSRRLSNPDPTSSEVISSKDVPTKYQVFFLKNERAVKVWSAKFTTGESGYIIIYSSDAPFSALREQYKQVLAAAGYQILTDNADELASLIEAENSTEDVRITLGEKGTGSSAAVVIVEKAR